MHTEIQNSQTKKLNTHNITKVKRKNANQLTKKKKQPTTT